MLAPVGGSGGPPSAFFCRPCPSSRGHVAPRAVIPSVFSSSSLGVSRSRPRPPLMAAVSYALSLGRGLPKCPSGRGSVPTQQPESGRAPVGIWGRPGLGQALQHHPPHQARLCTGGETEDQRGRAASQGSHSPEREWRDRLLSWKCRFPMPHWLAWAPVPTFVLPSQLA